MSMSAAVLDVVSRQKAPMTIEEINRAMGGKRDYSTNVYALVQQRRLVRVGTKKPGRFNLPTPTACAANDAPHQEAQLPPTFAASLGLGMTAIEPGGCAPAVLATAATEPAAPDPSPDGIPSASPPAPRPRAAPGRIAFPTDTALRLIALALSQPAQLEKADRELIAETIHSISDQLPA